MIYFPCRAGFSRIKIIMSHKKLQFTRHHYLKQQLDRFARQEPQIPVSVLDAVKKYCTQHEMDAKDLSHRQIVRILAVGDNRRFAVHAPAIQRRLCGVEQETCSGWTTQSVKLRASDEHVYERRSCSICLCALHSEVECDDGKKQPLEIKMLLCQHAFHKACIDEWLTLAPTCPYCRQAQTLRTTALGCDLESFVARYVGRPLLALLHELLKPIANAWAALVRDKGKQIVFPSDYCMAQIAAVLCESALLCDENTRHLADVVQRLDSMDAKDMARQHNTWLAIVQRWQSDAERFLTVETQ